MAVVQNQAESHSDPSGSLRDLAFLGRSSYAYGPVLFAQGAMLAGVVASRVLYRGQNLMSFKLQIGYRPVSIGLGLRYFAI
jgi:hypothetical protein